MGRVHDLPSNDGVKQSKTQVKTNKGRSGGHVYSCKFFNFFLGAIGNGRATVGCPIGSKKGYGCQKQKKNQVGWHRYKFLGGIGTFPSLTILLGLPGALPEFPLRCNLALSIKRDP